MKLTNISLAVLVALGLVACGGSDDNKNQTTDPKPPKEIPGDGGNGGNGGTPPKTDDNNIDPTRKAADLTVPPALVNSVNTDKQVLISNQFGDKALGYETDGVTYDEDKSTKPGDVKFTTTYNFSEEGDVFTTNTPATANQVGAIFPHKNPAAGTKQNAFVKGKSGKYYRVRSEEKVFDNYTAKTTYQLVDPIMNNIGNPTAKKDATKDIGSTTGMGIPQNKVVFLANATIDDTKTKANDYIIDPATRTNMDASLAQAVLTRVSVLGNSYNPGNINQTLDLNKIPVDASKITTVPVVGDLTIINGKNDTDANDRVVNREIELGHLKAYNLGYSIAYVALDSSKENSKNIFNLNNARVTTGDVNAGSHLDVDFGVPGQYQVSGYKTLALPKDGRAIYKGKSFSESTEGDVQLVAEFFSDRASVKGLVENRKAILDNNKKLPNLTLQPIQLTDPSKHITGGSGKVTGDNAHFNEWSVQFYGLEAEEAGGYLKGNSFEVYTTSRDRLSNQSNDASVK